MTVHMCLHVSFSGLYLITGICLVLFIACCMIYVQKPDLRPVHLQGNVNPILKCPSHKGCTFDQFAFYIRSGVANVVPPKICFQGKVIISAANMNTGPGLNIALLDNKTGNVVSSEFHFQGSDLLDFLRGIMPGHIILIASYDNPASMLTGEIREIFMGLGSSIIQRVGTCDSWVFAVQKGSKERPFEKYIPNDEKTNTYKEWPDYIELSGCLSKRI
ncbi:protein FAM3C isoform X1 [Alosa pseudoharengus]|uniref:protein FAM3C isoform X1 n=1 Tax=Alosa pseudoharengus TaxID=34774 RepID=UPI003F893760